MNALLKSKTFWTAVVGTITAVGAYFTGDLAFAEMIQAVFAALVIIFLRQGVAKSGPEGN